MQGTPPIPVATIRLTLEPGSARFEHARLLLCPDVRHPVWRTRHVDTVDEVLDEIARWLREWDRA